MKRYLIPALFFFGAYAAADFVNYPTASCITCALPAGTNLIGHVIVDSGTVSFTNSANGNTGAAVPAQATLVGGSDGVNLRAVKVSASGVVSVDGSAVTQPVSVASLPLPAGASTSALQTTGNASLASIVANTGNFPAQGAATIANSTPVNIASNQVVPISATSLPLPTGASTSALQTAGNASLASIDTKLTAPLTTTGTIGRSVVTTARLDYTGTNVTSGAWVQLIASTGADTNVLEIFDSSGQTLEIGTGAAASETRLILDFPGGNGQVPVFIPSGTRISIRAVSATADAGEIDVNLYH